MNRYVGESQLFRPIPATPFWHLGGEPFWSLSRNYGGRLEDVKTTPSAGALVAMGVTASLGDELIELLKDETACDCLRSLLVGHYLIRQ